MHPGAPGRREQHRRPPPRSSRRTGTRSPDPVRDGERVCPRRPETRPRGPVAHPVRPSPSPVRPSRGPGARDWIHDLAGTRGAPPGTDMFVRRYRRVEQVHPPGAPWRTGCSGRSSTAHRRAGTYRCSRGAPRRAPYVPLDGHVRRVPGGARRAVPAGDVPAAPPGRTYRPGTGGAPGTPRRDARTSPTSSRPTWSTCSTARVLPGGTGARRCCRGGSQGRVPRRGLPAPASRYRRGRGSDRHDVLLVASPVPEGSPVRHPGRGAPPYGTVVRPVRPRRGCTRSTDRRTRRRIPGSRRSGSRSPPRRGARGSGFLMFRNPFPPGRRREQPPVRPREQGVRGPYRYEFAG